MKTNKNLNWSEVPHPTTNRVKQDDQKWSTYYQSPRNFFPLYTPDHSKDIADHVLVIVRTMYSKFPFQSPTQQVAPGNLRR